MFGVRQESLLSHYRDRQHLDMRIWVLGKRGSKFGSDIQCFLSRQKKKDLSE